MEEADMGTYIHFVGAGEDGNRTTIELSRIYNEIRDSLFYEGHNQPQNHFHIHSYPCTKTTGLDVKGHFIILAGAINDPCWKEARETLHKSNPYLMMTIGAGYEYPVIPNLSLPFNNECLAFTDRFLVEPVKIAQLVLQIFFIHMPWNICKMGSIIDYDLSETKHAFAGKVIKVIKMVSDKEHYRQNFSRFLNENKADLNRSRRILMSLWGKEKVLSVSKASELGDEMDFFVRPNIQRMLTLHILLEDCPDFMAIIFIAF